MTREMRYHSVNNSYTVKKKGKPAYSLTGFLICVILPLLISLAVTTYFFMRSIAFNVVTDSVSYNSILPQPSYTVSIKEDNNYYNKTELPSDMKYVSSLIETINPTFTYDFHATEPLDIKYDYAVVSKYVVIDYTDEKTQLTEPETTVLKSDSKSIASPSVQISESVNIDFQKYAQKALDYKQTLRVPALAKLYVYITVNIDARKPGLDDGYKETLIQELEIPLTESITDIKKTKNAINKQDFMNSVSKYVISNVPFFIAACLFFLVDILFTIRLIYEYKRYKKKDLYTSIVSKLLKDYDRIIVSGKLDIDESKYNNIIYPETFEKLVDASVNEGSPILYYNVIPGQKCFFIIINGDTMYKFRITRWYVDENGHA